MIKTLDLRGRRKALGITRIQLAQLADCSPAWLGQIEAGYTPSRESPALNRALDALDHLEQKARDD